MVVANTFATQIQKLHKELKVTLHFFKHFLHLYFAFLLFCCAMVSRSTKRHIYKEFALLCYPNLRGEMFRRTKRSRAVFHENLINLNILPHIFA